MISDPRTTNHTTPLLPPHQCLCWGMLRAPTCLCLCWLWQTCLDCTKSVFSSLLLLLNGWLCATKKSPFTVPVTFTKKRQHQAHVPHHLLVNHVLCALCSVPPSGNPAPQTAFASLLLEMFVMVQHLDVTVCWIPDLHCPDKCCHNVHVT